MSRIRHPLIAALVAPLLSLTFTHDAESSPPNIDVWYGPTQQFGHIGNPQTWVNILGNVSDPDGVSSLVYTLNGGPERTLSIGPDSRRLAHPGDFNVDIAVEELLDGSNQVVITATDNNDHQSVENVTIEYSAGNVWPLPYTIDWSTAASIDEVVAFTPEEL